jgi:predicted RND superfamily exporter protein
MRFEEMVIRYAWAIIICTVIAVGLAVIPILNSRINSDLESYIPETMNSRANTEKIAEIFGDTEPVVIIFESEDVLNRETLQRLQDLSAGFESTGAFSGIYSLADAKSIKGEDGFLLVENIIGDLPETEEETEDLRRNIMEEDLAYGLVVSEDFRYTMMILKSGRTMNDDDLMKLVEETLEMYPGTERVHINAMPFLRSEAGNRISKDLLLLLPLGLVLMFVFLLVSFREWRGVLLPMLVVLISIVISMAMIPLFGWELTIISILIPVMMIAVANNYGIHFISKYQEINTEDGKGTMRDIVRETVRYLGKPVLFTGLTTIAGVLGLVTHILIPASRMGIISAISIGIALLLSLTLIPGIMIFLKKSNKHKDYTRSKLSPVTRVLDSCGRFVAGNPKFIVAAFGIFLMLAASGLMRFRLAADSDNVLPADHSFNVAARIADEHFGGTKILYLVFTGDVRDPEMMQRLDHYNTAIGEIEGIGAVNSIATVIRKMSIALNDEGDKYYDRIPDTYEAISQYLELYNMNGDPADLEEFVDFNFEHALMTIQYRAGNIDHVRQVIMETERIVEKDPGYMAMGGFSLIDKELSEAVMLGQKYSLIFAFTVILILMWMIYRSWKAGVLGSIPLFFAVVSTFGLMGWLDIELNIVTALMSSVSIGLGVDFTIHIFWRIRNELLSGSTYGEAVPTALRTTGRGISINAVSVVLGFSVLFASAFPIIRSFAFLIIISLIFCLLCAMLLIPALCILLKPAFLSNNYKNQKFQK